MIALGKIQEFQDFPKKEGLHSKPTKNMYRAKILSLIRSGVSK